LRFDGIFDVPAGPEQVYGLVTEPKEVARCLPDLQSLEVASPDVFDAVVKAGVSFIKGDFKIHFTVIEKQPTSLVRLKAHGTGLGSAVDMQIEARITAKAGRGSSMKWNVDALVSGKIASLGQRVLEAQAQKIIKALFDCLHAKLEG
jgi:uncharacterized protein